MIKIKELEKATSIKELVETIKEFYASYNHDGYIPALFQEGYFTISGLKNGVEEDCSEFYAKLIIRPYNHKMTNSWQVGNLSQGFIDGSILEDEEREESNFIYNLIVHRKMYGNNVYCLNPMLYNRLEYIDEENYKNNGVVNAFYSDENEKVPLIKKDDNDNLMLYKKSIEDYMIDADSNSYPNYILSVEFEYRNTDKHITDKEDYVTKTEYIDNVSKTMPIHGEQDFLWLIGTVDIPFVNSEDRSLSIITNSLNGHQRPLNEKNYNDDTDAGLIVFDYSCLEFLMERYVILGFIMIDTFEETSTLIDLVDDIVVFWEGEFNKLPYITQKGLEKYNNQERTSNIISSAMFDWQLEVKQNYLDKAEPFQKLGNYLWENHEELVREYKCNVTLPRTEKLFIEQANTILKITKLAVKEIEWDKMAPRAFFAIETLLEKKELIVDIKNLPVMFQNFCVLILNQVDKDYVTAISRELQ